MSTDKLPEAVMEQIERAAAGLERKRCHVQREHANNPLSQIQHVAMTPDPQGPWVRFSDLQPFGERVAEAAAQQEHARLQRIVQRLEREKAQLQTIVNSHEREMYRVAAHPPPTPEEP